MGEGLEQTLVSIWTKQGRAWHHNGLGGCSDTTEGQNPLVLPCAFSCHIFLPAMTLATYLILACHCTWVGVSRVPSAPAPLPVLGTHPVLRK